MEDVFLPESVREPSLPGTNEWTPEQAIQKITDISNRVQKLKPAVEDIIMEFWIAHEMIVNKKVKGWTWGRFCEQCGYSDRTPINWFQKYGLSYTKTSQGGLRPTKNLVTESSPTTKPETKEKLKEINQAIESGEITNRDLEDTRRALNKTGHNPEKRKEFVDQLPKKSRLRRLNDRLVGVLEELHHYADGNIDPERGDEVWIKAIKMKGPGFIWQFHKLGVDLNRVYQTLINPGKEISYESEREKREKWDKEEGVIDIKP